MHGCLTLHSLYTCLCVMLSVCACVHAWAELATVTLSYSQRYVQSSLQMDVWPPKGSSIVNLFMLLVLCVLSVQVL